MKKNMISIISMMIVFTMLFVLATGCATQKSPPKPGEGTNQEKDKQKEDQQETPEPGTKPVTIQFWNAFTGSDGDVLREIVNNYNSSNKKGIKIEMDIMPGASLGEKLPATIATGTAPALALLGTFDVVSYSKTGSILPMDDFFETTGVKKDDFEPAVLEGFQYEGKQMMIPMQWFSTFLYWNKDLFKDAGLDPEVPPKTWDEVADFAEKLTDPSKKQYGFGMPVSGAPSYFIGMFYANGGDVVDVENKKSLLDSPENLKTLEFVRDLAHDKKVSPVGATGADLDNLIFAGKLGMYANGPWLVNGLKENKINFGATTMPEGSEGAACVQEASGYVIPKGTDDASKAAAYDFVAHWNTTEIGKEWSLRNGFPPYLKSVISDPEIKDDPIVSTFSKMGSIARTFAPGIEVAPRIIGDVLFPLMESVQGGEDPKTELKKASDAIDDMLGK